MTYKTLKSMAKNLDFESEGEAADYIMSSYINGQFTQARRLYGDLRSDERSLAVQYWRELYSADMTLDAISTCTN